MSSGLLVDIGRLSPLWVAPFLRQVSREVKLSIIKQACEHACVCTGAEEAYGSRVRMVSSELRVIDESRVGWSRQTAERGENGEPV